MKRVRTVRLVGGSNTARGAKTTLWAYDAQALATITAMHIGSVQRLIRAGKLDPANFAEVIRWAAKRI